MSSKPPSWLPLHYIFNLERATINDLRQTIRTFPVIDNHAHNMLQPEKARGTSDFPFESITSEAQGSALTEHVGTSLSHIRAVKDLAALFGCRESWAEIVKARSEWIRQDYNGLIQKCLEGTHAIMMDDGLNGEIVQPYKWHRQLVPRVSRIVRIEAVAAEILEQLVRSSGQSKWDKHASETLLVRFDVKFRDQIRACADDPNVRGFKSVICYRTGLDVDVSSQKAPRSGQSTSDLLNAIHEFVADAVRRDSFRIEKKEFNDYLVVAVCEALSERAERIPFQFHTGLGDSDISLIKANPACLQNLIAAFPDVNFVLLHSSYPYTKEAGYLASAYSNAYLDIGEVFPMLSRDGQESVIREALDLSPSSKILWSTDGHFFPETYWLANKQFRVAFEKVLTEGVSNQDYSIPQAIDIAVNVYFFNSNRLYGLKEDENYPQLLDAIKMGKGDPTPTSDETVIALSSSDPAILQSFLSAHPDIKYVWLQAIDYTTTTRLRMIPIDSFKSIVRTAKYPSLTNGLLRLLQTDTIAEGGTATGQFQLQPDLKTLSPNVGYDAIANTATCQSFWLEDGTNKPLEGCPRSTLLKCIDKAESEGISFLMGFEIEICFVRRIPNSSGRVSFEPYSDPHAWNAIYPDTLSILPLVDQIVSTLSENGIKLSMFHPEGAPGQWEFVLPPLTPLEACDMLFHTRRIISNIAFSHNMQATSYPRPYPASCGTACHAHFSLAPTEKSDEFLAGVLDHLPGILALSLPVEESYQRVQGGIWAGGEWVAWGYQNKETPLRKIEDGHYELKTVDGLSNVYLAMAALLIAGLDGVRQGMPLTHKDCPFDPNQLTTQQRKEYGITTELPKTLQHALESLQVDAVLTRGLGQRFVENYIAVKQSEMAMLKAMEEDERRRWMIERY